MRQDKGPTYNGVLIKNNNCEESLIYYSLYELDSS